jgi:hypothetical protein
MAKKRLARGESLAADASNVNSMTRLGSLNPFLSSQAITNDKLLFDHYCRVNFKASKTLLRLNFEFPRLLYLKVVGYSSNVAPN